MDNDLPTEDGRASRRGRLMGKLFGRDRKVSNEQAPPSGGDLNDFFHGSSDKLQVAHAAPPMLAKLDTTNITRYPNALDINNRSQQSLTLRQSARSPRMPRRKGLVVRFVDTFPEIIGDGGDECEIPTFEIGKRRQQIRKAPPQPQPPAQRPVDLEVPASAHPDAFRREFVPTPIKRTQTGYSSIAEPAARPSLDEVPAVPAGNATSSKYLDSPIISTDEKRKSFIELHQAEMREAEGMAFAKAVRSASAGPEQPEQDWEEAKPPPAIPITESPVSAPQHSAPESPERTKKPNVEQSPSSTYSAASGYAQRWAAARQNSKLSDKEAASPSSPQKNALNLHDAVVAAGDDALEDFTRRTRHLFELFRLHAETFRPLSTCLPHDLAMAALWWFLKGRLSLESSVREQPVDEQGQQQNDMTRQQAYADLAKGLWLSEEAIPEVMAAKSSPIDTDVQEARQSLMSNLRKLAVSMKRNGFLPPEEAFLPQTIDKAIWLHYPSLSQDIIALLHGSWASALSASQTSVTSMSLLEALPLGDTADSFCFGRYSVDVFLMEQGIESQQYYFPSFLSIVRSPKHPNLEFYIASQNSAVQLRIQGNKNAGPTWDDVNWRTDNSSLELRLPRGFILAIQLAPNDYKYLWSIQDFSAKAMSTLYPRKDEQPLFRSTLRTFQFFDADPQSMQFPQEPVRHCEIGLFERIVKESAATGRRSFHRGYRIAVVTGPKTKILSAINQAYAPSMPIQFGFLRGEQDNPALLLKFNDGRSAGRMVLSFNDDNERFQFNSLLLGTALHNDERIISEVPLTAFTVSESLSSSTAIQCLNRLPWTRARVINEDRGDEPPPTVLADKLRVVVECKHGNVTDRINVEPGEFKVRLAVKATQSIAVLRQPQRDMTTAVSEAQVPPELVEELAGSLQLIRSAPTVRTYSFTSLRDLHDFQAALTGFTVLFDGVAAAVHIARRRMVVPIHKKWEAGATRIQVVQREKVVQLLVFFEDFHHGQSMSFALKGTDVYEAFSRSGKAGIKFDDAKWPLPKVAESGSPGDEGAFVCLDLPDLPGEHDDISILFEKEADRDQLAACLPAPMKGSRLSKWGSIRE